MPLSHRGWPDRSVEHDGVAVDAVLRDPAGDWAPEGASGVDLAAETALVARLAAGVEQAAFVGYLWDGVAREHAWGFVLVPPPEDVDGRGLAARVAVLQEALVLVLLDLGHDDEDLWSTRCPLRRTFRELPTG